MIFADGTSEPTNTRPVSIGGMLLNPAGNVVSYFGSYIFGSLLDVFLEEQRHTIFELEFFSSGRFAERGRNLSWENWYPIIWTTMQRDCPSFVQVLRHP